MGEEAAANVNATFATMVGLSELLSVLHDVGEEVLAQERRRAADEDDIAASVLKALGPTDGDSEGEEAIRAALRGIVIALVDTGDDAEEDEGPVRVKARAKGKKKR